MAESPNVGRMMPQIDLPAIGGGRMATRNLKGRKNLVLYFFDPASDACLSNLNQLAEILASCRELDAEMAAIGGEDLDTLSNRLGSRSLPFPVLADGDGEARSRLGASQAVLIIADRFGQIRERWDLDCGTAPDKTRIVDVLSLIELECPECGVPTWQD